VHYACPLTLSAFDSRAMRRRSLLIKSKKSCSASASSSSMLCAGAAGSPPPSAACTQHRTQDITSARLTHFRAARCDMFCCCFCLSFSFFCARQHICCKRAYAIAIPSVRLSVRLSHGWISQTRLKLGSCNFHHTVALSL